MTTHSENCTAWLLMRGSLQLKIEDQTFNIHSGQWVFPKVGQWHHEFHRDAQILSIRFQCCWPDGRHLYQNNQTRIISAKKEPLLKSRAKILNEFVHNNFGSTITTDLYSRSTDWGKFLKLKQLFDFWLSAYHQTFQKLKIAPEPLRLLDDRVHQALTYIETMPLHQKLLIAELSKKVGLSAVHLDRLFSIQLGCSPAKHFENRRFEYAKLKLQYPQSRIKALALELGFKSMAQFSTWFHRLAHRSPRAFKKSQSRVISQ
jgi:AraC-like DNA-binding protein